LPTLNEDSDFVPSVYGINDHEQVKRGDIRKVNIDCKIPYTANQLRSVDGIEYRLYVMEGEKQCDVISWTKVERGYNENYFLNSYYIHKDIFFSKLQFYVEIVVHL